MKRSRHVALLLVGTAALAGCGEETQESTIFQSLADCRQFYDEDICRTKATEAEQLHAETAPKYQSKESCEAQFGAEACVPTPTPPAGQAQTTSTSWFMPAMMGFMLGNALSRPAPLYYGAPNVAGVPQGQRPVYSGNSYMGSTPASARPRWSATAPASTGGQRTALSPSTSRGGFGSTGRSYSGGGS